jgi:uncharacterized protein YlxW (UPF0749 family)
MGKRRGDEGDAISLFPFLSVLACVIGVLAMLIVALALSQVTKDDPQDEAERKKAEERLKQFRELQSKVKVDVKELERLRKLVKELEAQHKAKLAQIEEFKKKNAERVKQIEKEMELLKLVTDLELIKQRIATLLEDIKKLKDENQKLEVELKRRKNPQSMATVTVRPSGSGVGLKPAFVECAAASLVIYTNDPPPRVRTADLRLSMAFTNLLASVSADTNKTLVFLVREDGASTFFTASRIATELGVRNGKLPIMGQGNIDLSLFTPR